MDNEFLKSAADKIRSHEHKNLQEHKTSQSDNTVGTDKTNENPAKIWKFELLKKCMPEKRMM